MKNIKEIEKRKLINLIIQGEAKNTKHILQMPEVREGLKEILGDERGEELFISLRNLTLAADRLDWLENPEIRARMMERGDAFGGAVDIIWT